MNSIRTSLPILSRPSRPSSPAPPSQTTTTAAGSTLQPTAASQIETQRRSRSLSRQVTDKIAVSLQGSNGAPPAVTPSQPLEKKISPPSSRPGTPRTADHPPHAGHMESVSLRLNEAVNKAWFGVDVKSKKGFKLHAGWTVGEAVIKELPYPVNDAYLMRAVLRTVNRSLTIYVSRLESFLLPALSDPSFSVPFNLHSPVVHPLNALQFFALSVAHAAWETSEVLEGALEGAKWPQYVHETLRPVMKHLDMITSKVINPFLLSVKKDLVRSLSMTEGTSPPGGKVVGLASIPAPAGAPVPAKEPSRLTKEPSDRGRERQLPIPTILQHFANRIDGSHKVLKLIAGPCREDGEGWITSIVVAVAWKGLLVIAEKEYKGENRPPSPGSVAKALNGLAKEKEITPAAATSSLGGVASKLNSLNILPSRAQSRPPSPPRGAQKYDPRTLATMSLEGLLKRLIHGLIHPPDTNGVSTPGQVAREAAHEALESITSFRTVAAAMTAPTSSARILASLRRVRDDIDDLGEEELDDAIEDVPASILFKLLRDRANYSLAHLHDASSEKEHALRIRHPGELLGLGREAFEQKSLTGFTASEEWEHRVADLLKAEVERVLSALVAEMGEKPTKEQMEAIEWVRALGVAFAARTGVKVAGA